MNKLNSLKCPKTTLWPISTSVFSDFQHLCITIDYLCIHGRISWTKKKSENHDVGWVKVFATKMSEFKHRSRFPYLIIKILMIWCIFMIFVQTARSFIVCWQSVYMCRRLLIKNNLLWLCLQNYIVSKITLLTPRNSICCLWHCIAYESHQWSCSIKSGRLELLHTVLGFTI
jgi:hypothetical protein